VGAIGAFRRQREHLRAERREDPPRRRRRRRGQEERGVHVVEVLPHRRERRGVRRPAHHLDRRLVTHTDPEDEPARERFFDRE
jgi:hypothetical protein